jgi:hypothetical protein
VRWVPLAAALAALPAPADAREPKSFPIPRPEPAALPRPKPPRPSASPVGCSAFEPLCVHLGSFDVPPDAQRILEAAERAFAAYRALGLPRPLPDDRRGGSPAFDLYVEPAIDDPASFADDPSSVFRFDRASAYAVVPPVAPGPPCATDAMVARVVAQAILLGLDAATGDGTLAAGSTYLAQVVAPCPALETAAVDLVQRSPERAILRSSRGRPSGDLLFPWFLDAAYGAADDGAVFAMLVTAGAQLSAAELTDEPDVFDVLRRVLPPQGLRLGDVLLDFAVARAFAGTRADGEHLPDSERFGTFGRVRFEWSVPYATLPRRLGPARPIEATGSTYLWLDLADAPSGSGLVFDAAWEVAQVFQWALVRVDAQGREIGRQEVGGVFGNDRAQLTLEDLTDVAGILLVGVNLGGDDRSAPDDPDEPPREGGYEVTLYSKW